MTIGGLTVLSQLKKVLITVPDSLLEQVDLMAKSEKTNRSEFVREAMKLYLKSKKHAEYEEQMKKGYREMGDINLSISEMYFDVENEQFSEYEEKLAECE